MTAIRMESAQLQRAIADSRRRRHLIERRIEFLRSEEVGLKRDYDRVPYLWATILLIIPCYLMWGLLGAIVVVLSTPSLVMTAYYIIRTRRVENFGDLRDLEGQIALLDAQTDDSEE